MSSQPSTARYCTRPCRSGSECESSYCSGGYCERSWSWTDLVAKLHIAPARFEVSPWVSLGGGARLEGGGSSAIFSLGAGIEGTFALSSPTDCLRDWSCARRALRAGPWLAFERSNARNLGEGGLALSWAPVDTISWSAFSLDLGAGHADSGATELVAKLDWGTRFVRMRSSIVGEGGACRAVVAPASGADIYVALRRETNGSGALELTAGIELHPFGAGFGIFPQLRR